MFFAEDGDLAPRIEVEDNNNPLTAYRYAPLAALETAPTAETGIIATAVPRNAREVTGRQCLSSHLSVMETTIYRTAAHCETVAASAQMTLLRRANDSWNRARTQPILHVVPR